MSVKTSAGAVCGATSATCCSRLDWISTTAASSATPRPMAGDGGARRRVRAGEVGQARCAAARATPARALPARSPRPQPERPEQAEGRRHPGDHDAGRERGRRGHHRHAPRDRTAASAAPTVSGPIFRPPGKVAAEQAGGRRRRGPAPAGASEKAAAESRPKAAAFGKRPGIDGEQRRHRQLVLDQRAQHQRRGRAHGQADGDAQRPPGGRSGSDRRCAPARPRRPAPSGWRSAGLRASR